MAQEEVFKIVGSVLLKDSEFISGLKNIMNEANNTATKLSKRFETIGNGFKTVGDKVSKVGATMTATLTTGVVGLATAGIKYNAQMETFQANLTTLLGDSDKANKLLGDLKEMAATTPFETTDLINATQTMIGFGVSAQDSQKYLSMLGDIAMGDGEKLQGLSLAFAQVQSTGKLTGQDLLQMINQGFNPLPYICKKSGESMAEVKERMGEGKVSAQEVAEAMQMATSKGGPFFNSMDKASQTVNGRLSTLKDNFMEMIGKLTESLLPTFSKIVDKLTEVVNWFSNLDEEQRNNILKWAGIVAAAGPVLMILGKLSSGIGGIFSILGKLAGNKTAVTLFTKMKTVITTLFNPINLVKSGIGGLKTAFLSIGSVGTKIAAIFSGANGGLAGVFAVLKTGVMGVVGGFSSLLGTLASVIAPVLAVAGVVYVLWQHWDKVVQTFKNFAENVGLTQKLQEIKDKLQPLWEKIKGLKDLLLVVGSVIGGALSIGFGILMGLFNGVISAISPLIDALGGIIDILAGIGSFIVAIFTGDMQKAGDSIVKIEDGIVNVFSGLWGTVKEFVKGFVDGVVGFFTGLWDTLVGHSIVPDTINSIIDWFKNLLGKPLEFVKNMKDKVTGFFGNLKDGAVNKAKEMASNVVNKYNELKTNAVNKFNELKSQASEKFNSMKTAVVNKASEIKNNAVNKFNELKTNAASKFENLRSTASTKFNSIKSTITDKVSQAKSKAVDYFQQMNTATNGKLGSLVSTVSNKFGAVYDKIKSKMNDAKNKVSEVIENMKSVFSNFSAHIKLPHFKVHNWSWNPKDWITNGVPSLSVEWYKKAMDNGMILNDPTIFGINSNGQLMAGGEAGSETVVGTNSLMNMIRNAVSNQNAEVVALLETILNVLSIYLPDLSNMQVALDSGQLVGALMPKIDSGLGNITEKRGRGR